MTAGKRQRWTRGAVVAIALGEREYAFGQMLESPEYAFFDCRSPAVQRPADVVGRPVLFRLWVNVASYTSGRWPKLGTAPVAVELQSAVPRYNQDPLRPQDIRRTFDGFTGPLVSADECRGLECAAVWDAGQVEDRLRSHFAGVPCGWTTQLRLKASGPA